MTNEKEEPNNEPGQDNSHKPDATESQQMDDSSIARLLKLGGAQEAPSGSARDRARSAVQGAWRQKLTQRRKRLYLRNTGWAALAATIALSIWVLIDTRLVDQAPSIAVIERSTGRVDIIQPGETLSSAEVQPLIAGTQLHTWVDSQVGLKTAGGTRLLMDRDTRVTLISSRQIRLQEGRVFVDSPPGATDILVQTPQGDLKELGTQFEVQVTHFRLHVRMREGRVAVQNPEREIVLQTREGVGDVVELSQDGHAVLSSMATTDAHWNWYRNVTPAFDIENARLLDFLRWYAREAGKQLRFASKGAEIAARNTRLHGSIEGMRLNAALDSVLSSTHLKIAPGKPFELVLAVPDLSTQL